jgi:hypothetical protein
VPRRRTRRLILGLIEGILEALLQSGDPRVDLGLRLEESLAQVVADGRQVVVDEAVVLIVLVVRPLALPWGVVAVAVRGARLVGANVVVVLGKLAGVKLIGLELRHLPAPLGSRRGRGRSILLWLVLGGVWIRHF